LAVNLYTFVGMYTRGLGTLAHLLAKGEAFAQEKGIAPDEILQWRLIEDMNPLSFQVRTVVNFARQWPARAIGAELPADVPETADLAGLKAAIAEAQTYLADLKPEAFEGRGDRSLTVNLGQAEFTLSVDQWITGFATTNFYFHLSTAYDILRARGVQIGKRDLFAGGL
jgi:hypothetical protein